MKFCICILSKFVTPKSVFRLVFNLFHSFSYIFNFYWFSLTTLSLSHFTFFSPYLPCTLYTTHAFLAERERDSLFAVARPSVCLSSVVCLSIVCNVRAPYSGGSNFRQYFYGIRYIRHRLTSTENFTEIVPGKPLRRGS